MVQIHADYNFFIYIVHEQMLMINGFHCIFRIIRMDFIYLAVHGLSCLQELELTAHALLVSELKKTQKTQGLAIVRAGSSIKWHIWYLCYKCTSTDFL